MPIHRKRLRHRAGPRAVVAMLIAVGLTACTPEAASGPAARPAAADASRPAPSDVSAKSSAHAALARRLRPFLIERGPAPRTPMAADDERFRLGAFWRARTDTHRFGPDVQAQARAALALPGDTPADDALRALLEVVDARLPDWQALVDYNASGRMRDDGGDGGRQRLPGAIAALDAIEVAVWDYVDAASATP